MNDTLVPISMAARKLGVSIDTLRRWDAAGRLRAVRSGPRGHRFYQQSDIMLFLRDSPAVGFEWASAPAGQAPESDVYCRTRDVFQARLEQLQTKLARLISLENVSLVTAVAGEIGNNSFDHNLGNWPDISGIFFAYDFSKRSVVLADRGQGILTTLRRIRPELASARDSLRVAFTESISGRFPESRGNGLKFVRSVITNNPLTLYFQTGDAALDLKQHDKALALRRADTVIRGCFATIGFEGAP